MKYAWIAQHAHVWPVAPLCRALDVSYSGFKDWRGGAKRATSRLSDARLLLSIQAVHVEFKGAYGSPRMHEELRGRGQRVGRTRVERVMHEHGIRARHKRRWRATTDSKHALAVAPNLIARDFCPKRPNQCWGADITYLWTDEGWLYLAVVLDFFNREIVGWSLREQLTATLACEALRMAYSRRQPQPGLIHHSDRGVQYASAAFQTELARYGMHCSMSRKANCWDNAPTESFFNSLKNERTHGRRYRTRAEARAEVFQYIEAFYNRNRRHSTLGYISPLRFLQNWRESEHKEAA